MRSFVGPLGGGSGDSKGRSLDGFTGLPFSTAEFAKLKLKRVETDKMSDREVRPRCAVP